MYDYFFISSEFLRIIKKIYLPLPVKDVSILSVELQIIVINYGKACNTLDVASGTQ